MEVLQVWGNGLLALYLVQDVLDTVAQGDGREIAFVYLEFRSEAGTVNLGEEGVCAAVVVVLKDDVGDGMEVAFYKHSYLVFGYSAFLRGRPPLFLGASVRLISTPMLMDSAALRLSSSTMSA